MCVYSQEFQVDQTLPPTGRNPWSMDHPKSLQKPFIVHQGRVILRLVWKRVMFPELWQTQPKWNFGGLPGYPETNRSPQTNWWLEDEIRISFWGTAIFSGVFLPVFGRLHIMPRKLTWQWKITIVHRRYIFRLVFLFHNSFQRYSFILGKNQSNA